MFNGSPFRWLKYRLGIQGPDTQTSAAERACLARHATGRRSLVEIGVMHGVGTAVLRSVMHPEGTLTAIDPHPVGRLGVSFERWIALREAARYPRGQVAFVRRCSHEAATSWKTPIDFLFIDGDHSWAGVDRDWRDWSAHVLPGGVVALHDSKSVADRPDLDSVRYTREVVLCDPSFREIDAVDSLTVVQRLAHASP